ncbi:hypothetical protein ACIODS_02630 [Micromonospora chalcea]|uniref:hypothetical protein n=1 Tax=Micromonospora chalcea TaxID=1874 RepID=UPI003827D2D0
MAASDRPVPHHHAELVSIMQQPTPISSPSLIHTTSAKWLHQADRDCTTTP